ncbi:MAG: methyltransferase domain-containing protein [Pseudohongiella sp.]|nr:methyltransferase domain-containing protein [Pseudohongiella sp.]
MYDVVKDYYGKQLQSSADLKTSACCDVSSMPEWLKPLLTRIHPDVLARYYGCGLVAPAALDGCTILDLGCGTGRDVYALAQMVGAHGRIIGLDMTEQQLAVAEQHKTWHATQFGYDNVQFVQGYMEQLDQLDLAPGSVDVIVSNCVLNLSPDKTSVLKGIFRLLKLGGEFYFSDVYADRRVPDAVKNDPELYGECLGGALYWNDFQHMARRAGFTDPRLVEDRPLTMMDPAIAARIGPVHFYSATYRLFKLEGLEPDCEDYGQAVIYKGTLPNAPDRFVLDKHHDIETGRVFPVCGNTWRMLHDTRFAAHFEFIGDFSKHFGLFEGCGGGLPFDITASGNTSAACC